MRKNKNPFNEFIKKIDEYPRINIIFGFFILIFAIILSKVFSYTVFDYKFYKNLANKQQIWKIDDPITRWNIYSKKKWVFAGSAKRYDIAIDPNMEGDRAKLILFLRNIVYKDLCWVKKTKKECYEWILKFTKKLEIENFVREEKYLKNLILNRLKYKLSRKNVTSLLLATEVLDVNILKVQKLFLKGVYAKNWNVYINPEEITDKKNVSEKLAQHLPILQPRIEYLIRKRKVRYIPILQKLWIDVSDEVISYLKEEEEALNKWIIDIDASLLKYVILTPYPNRYYPEKSLASQVVWFTWNDWEWHYWIEWFFNKILKWNDWYTISKKDVNWRTIDPIEFETTNLFSEWVKIYSTIDKKIQKNVERFLEAGVKKYGANKWTVVIMNPKTWKVIAMANYPSFDLNNPWKVYELEKVNPKKYRNMIFELKGKPVFVEDSKDWKEFYFDWKKIFLREATKNEIWNYALVKYKYVNDFGPAVYKNDAISSIYEPGSIMKPITVSIWIDSWEINKYSMYQDNWKVTIDQFTIANVSRACLWYHSFAHALNYSCNVWMLRIAQKYWKALAYEYLNSFWFSNKTGIYLEWEVTTEVAPLKIWSSAKLLTSSYWLWIWVTPLQMAVAYSVFANGWYYVKPQIVDYIKYPNWKIIDFKPEFDHKVIKKATADILSDMLVDSLTNWVAKNWYVEWYRLAWKTWTSDIAIRWGYDSGWASTFASFAWFWPVEDPKFVVIVKLDRPRASIYWGLTSAYIFKDIASYLLDYYKIPSREKKK